MRARSVKPTIGPTARTWLVTAGVVCVAALLVAIIVVRHGVMVPPKSVALFFVLFLVAERIFFEFESRRRDYISVATEIPLLLALFFLPPFWLVATRIGTAMVGYLFRQPPVKALYNIGMRAVGTAAAVLFVQAFVPLDARHPATWGVLVGAIGISNAISAVGLTAIITADQGWLGWRKFFDSALALILIGTLNAVLGLLVLLALHTSAWALVPLAALAVGIGIAYRAYSRSRRQHKSLAELYEITGALDTAREEGNLADVLLVRARELLNAEYATLWLPALGRYPELLLTARLEETGLLDEPAKPNPLCRRAVDTGRAVIVNPRTPEPELRSALASTGRKDVIAVPMRVGAVVIGCLEVSNRLGDRLHFSDEDVRLLETLAAHAAVAVENSRLVDRLRFDAYHDALTSLPNRRRLIGALEEAVKVRAPGEVVAVLMFDVDGLRDVNDSLGHAAGDKLLAETARRLRDVAPPSALVARAGGDEFVVLLRIGGAGAALALASELRTALQEPFVLGSLTLDVGAAVGVALHPDHGSAPEALLQRADLATYAAKQVTSGIQLFNLGLESRSVRRLGLAGDLRRALDAEELEIYFQPKVALADRRLIGVECLARWEHPAHGSVDPADFVAVAEHTGQLGRLTEVVLREGLRRCRDWYSQGRPLSVAVNLSPRTLIDPEFPARVEALLNEYRVAPDRLTLEITEDGVVGETDRPMPTLRRLRDLGVRLSVDDFGTGYSSLSYLRRLPVHEVKVDRTFVQGMATDPGDLAIVRAVVDLSRHFGLSVVAEGVESELTLSLLEEMACDVGQGFYFSRPLPYERFEAWCTAQTEVESTPAGEVRRLRIVT